MSRFTKQVKINAPTHQVWEVLADIGGIYKWNPGVAHSYSTSEENSGEGATRHCDLQTPGGKSFGYLEERTVDWREGESYKIAIYDSNLPIKSNVVEFAVKAVEDGTIVSVSPEYAIKFGLLGSLMNRLFLQRKLQQGMEGLLAGLKYHVETGEIVESKLPKGAVKSASAA